MNPRTVTLLALLAIACLTASSWPQVEQPTAHAATRPLAPVTDSVNYTPHGRPIDLSRSDWLITQDFAQHIANEGIGTGGLDYAFVHNVAAYGSPIHATMAGVATVEQDRGDGTGYGNSVVLHGYINPATGISYNLRFGHLQRIAVTDGAAVKAGEVLGEMGNTGWSSGPHLHYAISRCKDGACSEIDPAPFVGN